MTDKTVIRQKFEHSGLSIADWARQNNFSPDLVYSVLKSKHIPIRGQSHKIAVKLGLKEDINVPIFSFDTNKETN
ncbi:DNA-binding protein [Acinetobacter junii]|uniref:DNA-binding protein n=1 Tax=Acinetobacter junii TaxID=40215 RepID=UPI003A8BF9AC